MFDAIRQRISQARDFAEVWQCISCLSEPRVLLTVIGVRGAGELWIEDGQRVIGARASLTGDTGYLALVQILSMQNAKFDIVKIISPAPHPTTEVRVVDLAHDQKHTVANLKQTVVREIDQTELPIRPVYALRPAPKPEPPRKWGKTASAENAQLKFIAIKTSDLRKKLSKKVLISGAAAAMLATVGLFAFERVTIAKQLNEYDKEIVAWHVNRSLDDETAERKSSALIVAYAFVENLKMPELPKFRFMFKLPDMHSPFRPPAIRSRAVQNNPHSAVQQPASQSVASATVESGSDIPQWNPPTVAKFELTSVEQADLQELIRRAERAAANGRPEEAASIYSIAVSRFPYESKLRVAAISAYKQTDNYASARALCIEGMRFSPTHNDYVVFLNLYRNLNAQSAP